MKMSPCRIWTCIFILLAAWMGHVTAEAQLPAFTDTNAFPGLSFANPVCIASAPGETNRLFICEQGGVLVVITNLANPTRTVFLDISSQITIGENGEGGLLGLAFHPGFASNHLFYIYYTGPATNEASGLHDILSRYQAWAWDPNLADAGSEQRLIVQKDDYDNHNAGDIHFGSDGYLYLSLGDEGGGGDTGNNSQRIDKDFFSGIIRIDVDQKPGNLTPNTHPASIPGTYKIPADNPFVGVTNFNGLTVNSNNVRTEFWAVGLRNPWRWSFDPVTGLAYCGDVGQGAREEVDIIKKGGNYGWAYREGFIAGPKAAPPVTTNRIDPILDYDRTEGNCVIGGVVYRGSRFPSLYGYYVFCDIGSGSVWALTYDGTNASPKQTLFTEAGISAFGADPNTGDVLACNLNSSSIRRIVAVTPPGSLQVTIAPPLAVTLGAQWRVDGGSYQNSGVTFSNLSPGNHTVSYKAMSDWAAPANQTVNITGGVTTTTNGTYVLTDATKPTISITQPTSGQSLTQSVFSASGTVFDSIGVTSVWYQVNSSAWTAATFTPGGTNWSAPGVAVVPGANTLRVYAVDYAGNVSTTNSVNFFRSVLIPIGIQIVGLGTVGPITNGELLEFGKTYSTTAKAGSGFKFVNWTGSVVTNKSKVTFIMSSNLTFTANFHDVKPPTLIVTFPPVNKKLTNSVLTIAGKTADNSGVTGVGYLLNGITWNPATTTNAWTNWTASGLIPNVGQNLLRAWAMDSDGNISKTNSVKFTYEASSTTDWAPDSLSGLAGLVHSVSTVGFDALTFSQTGAGTNDDFNVGNYSYAKTGTNTAQLTLTNIAPPTQTNDTGGTVDLIFTNHYSGIFTNDNSESGPITLFIATNFVPTSVKKIIAAGSHGTHTIALKSNGTFTLTPSLSAMTSSSAGNYTFTRFSPIGAMLVLTFTGSDAGTTVYVQMTFTSSKAGTYLSTTYGASGGPTDIDLSTFTLP